jgi:hypothetical protein
MISDTDRVFILPGTCSWKLLLETVRPDIFGIFLRNIKVLRKPHTYMESYQPMERTAEVVAQTTRLNVPCAWPAKASTMEKLQEIYIHRVKST